MCSTIRPLTLRNCFGWLQGNHVWKAPTSTFHSNLFLPGLLQPVSRSKGPKCARLSAPSLCATVLVGFKETMYGKPQPVPFTRTFFRQDCSNQFRDPRVQSVLDYPPPPSAPLFWLVSRKPCMESPNKYLSPEPSFARIAPTSVHKTRILVFSDFRILGFFFFFFLVVWFFGSLVFRGFFFFWFSGFFFFFFPQKTQPDIFWFFFFFPFFFLGFWFFSFFFFFSKKRE